MVDGEVDRPPADDGEDEVHAQVEHQQEEGHGLQVVGHFCRTYVMYFRKIPPLGYLHELSVADGLTIEAVMPDARFQKLDGFAVYIHE